jgi:hypothetical protein
VIDNICPVYFRYIDAPDHNGSKSLIIIDIGTLYESMKNPAGLISLKCPVDLELVFENLFTCDNIGTTRAWNQVLSVVAHESSILFLHSHLPMRISEDGLNGLRDGRECGGDVELGLPEADNSSGPHQMWMNHGETGPHRSAARRHWLGDQRRDGCHRGGSRRSRRGRDGCGGRNQSHCGHTCGGE